MCAALLLVGTAGCGADEPEAISLPGDEVFVTMSGALPLDFVMEQLPDGGITSSGDLLEEALVHGYLVDRYLVDGAKIDIVWIHDPAVGFPKTGDLRTQVNPIIFRNEQMDGRGWEHLDMRAAEWNIVDRSQGTDAPVESVEPEPLEESDTRASAGVGSGSGEGAEGSGEASEASESFSF
jgi:hypothetical protein